MSRYLSGSGRVDDYHSLAITKEAEDLISFIMSSPPSRNPREHKDNVCTLYRSKKMLGMIKVESLKVEFPMLLEAEHNDVHKCFDQPP